ncbi:HVA22-like protein k [Elaeis guineensis]|uniref:HVA22-like protein n=1 Tax=Elaeis guineensis var. tenera TaxID=51953 RepID=A0A6I9RC44_ELAGV|nr:HVA22-like protein k isoform X1 [Elaeis guineensis]XP_010923443.1 HVA22-like protein k isoform X1 [Elaeis guineensis]
MALLGSAIPSEVGLRLLLCPIGSNIVTRTACCTVGIGLPIYSTFKAIEKKDRNEQEKWLLYWAAYGSFSLVEVFSDKILSWFPFYYHMKFAFLVWLQLPSGNGSKHLYARHLRPFLLKHQARIDRLLGFLSTEIEKFMSAHHGEIQFVKALVVKCAMTANQMVKDLTHPVQPQGQNMIEGPSPPTRRETHDSGSDAEN